MSNTKSEILFRGKRADNGEWVYGAYGNHTSLDAMIIDRPYLTSNSDLSALNFWMVDPATVGQYTGLYDATKWEALSESEQKEWLETHTADEWKGRKIFEGDILKTDEYEFIVKFGECGGVNNVEHKVGYIGFYVETFGTFADIFLKSGLRTDILYWINSCDCEVIGNIHDKSELFT